MVLRRFHGTVSNPYGLIDIDPQDVQYYLVEGPHQATNHRDVKPVGDRHKLEKAFFHWQSHVGLVLGGDWDKYRKPYEFDRIYQAIREHYVDGVPWEETEYGVTIGLAQELDSRRGDGYADRRIPETEALFRDIRENGYVPAERPESNVIVNIGRNGEFIFNNVGHHRLAMANVLDLDSIPVLVAVRHREWQRVREEVSAATSLDELSEFAKEKLDHPDLQTIVDVHE